MDPQQQTERESVGAWGLPPGFSYLVSGGLWCHLPKRAVGKHGLLSRFSLKPVSTIKVDTSFLDLIRVASNIWISLLRALVVSFWRREIYQS